MACGATLSKYILFTVNFLFFVSKYNVFFLDNFEVIKTTTTTTTKQLKQKTTKGKETKQRTLIWYIFKHVPIIARWKIKLAN